jgi:rSAM/selenodomain-associated transferase 2
VSADARSLSIIVPVLNEAGLIRSFLAHLRQRATGAEIIVVDGGSTDATVTLAREICDRLIFAKRGRGTQMNAGARIATRDVFWFLHADTEVPVDCATEIARVLRDTKSVGGFFRISLPRDRAIYRLTDSLAHYLGYILRIRCGDHGFFCRREAFEKIGGFPDVPLMEDVDFFRALRRLGRVCAVHFRLRLNPRRYEKIGPIRLTFGYGLIATLYVAGTPRHILQSIYKRACSSATTEPPRNSSIWRCDSTWRSRAS